MQETALCIATYLGLSKRESPPEMQNLILSAFPLHDTQLMLKTQEAFKYREQSLEKATCRKSLVLF